MIVRNGRSRGFLWASVGLAFVGLTTAASARVLEPTVVGGEVANAGTWLNGEIAAAVADETLELPAARYCLDMPVNLNKSVTLRGASRSGVTLDGLDATNCVNIAAAGAVLSTLTVAHGIPANRSNHTPLRGYFYGGGIYMNNDGVVSNVTVTACGLTQTTRGGYEVTLANPVCAGCGVYMQAGLLVDSTVENCRVSYDSTPVLSVTGGGVYLGSAGNLSARACDCEIRFNEIYTRASSTSGNNGAGVYVANSATLERSRVSYNRADSPVAGATIWGAGAYICGLATNCLVSCNTNNGTDGGGCALNAGRLCCSTVSNNWCWGCGCGVDVRQSGTMEDCLIVANLGSQGAGDTTDNGGAVCGPIAMSRCVVRDNVTKRYGGAYYCNAASPTFTQCLFANNRAGASSSAFHFKTPATTGLLMDRCVVTGHDGAGLAVVTVTKAKAVVIRNSLFSENVGANVFNISLTSGAAGTVIENCSVAGNTLSGDAVKVADKTLPGDWLKIRNTFFETTGIPLMLTAAYPASITHNYDVVGTNLPKDGAGLPLYGNVMGGTPRYADAAHGNYHPAGKYLGRDAGEVLPWMADATDLGDGTWTVEKVADYGVRFVLNRRRARNKDGKPDIGCFECAASGLLLSVQ